MISRGMISQFYTKGDGLEIGAFHNPFPVFNGTITYLDKKSYEDLIQSRDGDKNLSSNLFIPPVDIVDDGQSLSKVEDASFDFVVSSHFLEHCHSPLNALENQLRVTKKGGILICIIPDRNNAIDRNRRVTCLSHLIDHYTFGVSQDEIYEHFLEYLQTVDKLELDDASKRARECMKNNADIHFHVWDTQAVIELLEWAQNGLEHEFQVELFFHDKNEHIFVLRKI